METMALERRKVYDPVLRLIHVVNALAIVFLAATGWSAEAFEKGPGEKTLWTLHIFAGYALAGGLTARVIWGLVGPKHARFSALWHPKEWAGALKMRFSPTLRFGHDPYASIAYIAFYLLVAGMVLTGFGLAAIEHAQGPLVPWLFDAVALEDVFEEPHEVMQLLIVGFVGLHLAGMLFHEWRDKTPMVSSMFSGYQYRRTTKGENDEK